MRQSSVPDLFTAKKPFLSPFVGFSMKKRLLATLAWMLLFCAGFPVFGQSISFTTNNIPLATQPKELAAADFNNDGKVDIVLDDIGASSN